MRKLYLLIASVFSSLMAFSQTPVVMGNGTYSTSGCDLVVYDNGGATGDYHTNHNDILTITSNDPANNAVKVEIVMASFDVDDSDTLFIYNGNSTTAPILAVLNNSLVSAVSAPSIIYAATISNASGAITLQFKSNGCNTGGGYAINVSCAAPCQRVEVELDTVLSSHVPQLDEDGFYYINLCPGDELHLVAHGVYPDNNYSYAQSDATSTFVWDFGTSTSQGLNMTATDFEFEEGRGYDVVIAATDAHGCPTYIPYSFRMRTSSNPIRDLKELPTVCMGETVELSLGYDMISDLQLDSVGSEQITSLQVTDTIFLPDGHDCGDGCAYVSPVTFTSFAPGSAITSANDILFVRLAIEHSYVGDIWIGLECPNGQQVTLMKKYGSAGYAECSPAIPAGEYGWLTSGSAYSYFGNYYEPDGSYCAANENPMGTCWNYCWSNTTNQGYQYNSGEYVYSNQNHINGNYLDSTNVASMTNVFKPDGNFSTMIGCPLNGTWKIKVVDGWGSDNGYICGWEIALDPSLLPQNWSYDVEVDTVYTEGPGADGHFMTPNEPGVLEYTVHVVDEYGCEYTANTTLEVNPPYEFNDTIVICPEELPYYYTIGDTTFLEDTHDTTNVAFYRHTVDNCDSIYNLLLIVHHLDIEMTDIQEEHCAQSDGRATVQIVNGTGPYEYVWDGVPFFEDSLASHLPGGAYSVTVNDAYCSASTNFHIEASTVPEAAFIVKPGVEQRFVETPLQFIDCSEYADAWHWDFGDKTTKDLQNCIHTYKESDTYTVMLAVSDQFNCRDTARQEIEIMDIMRIYLPNSFSPNGDGLNDEFKPIGVEISTEGYLFQIYSRWGECVFSTRDINEGWDGTVNGRLVEGGTYLTYIVQFQNLTGRRFVKKGDVLVL